MAVTVASDDYLPNVAVLARSFRSVHPEIPLYVFRLQRDAPWMLDGVAVEVDARETGLFDDPYLRLKLDRSEFAMAAKPSVLQWTAAHLAPRRILFLDADLCFFAPARELIARLDEHDWVVSPHVLTPYPHARRTWVRPDLTDIAGAGLINSGLFGLRVNAATGEFTEQWRDLCQGFGAFDPDRGHREEQKSFNWVLSFSQSVHVLRDPATNVAYWNLHERSLRGRRPDAFTVNGEPLVCFHFSGFDPHRPFQVSRHDRRHSYLDHPALASLLREYSSRVLSEEDRLGGADQESVAAWTTFPSGLEIDRRMRMLYKRHEATIANGLDPWTEEGEHYYASAMLRPQPGSGSLLPVLIRQLVDEQPSVRSAHPDCDVHPEPVLAWFAGEAERLGYGELLDRHRPTLPTVDHLLHFGEQVPRSALRGLDQPLGADRSKLLRRLEGTGDRAELARRLRTLDDEIWAETTMAGIRRLVRRRGIRSAYPEPLGDDHPRLVRWLRVYGAVEGLPADAAEVFERCRPSRTLARILSAMNRFRHLGEIAPLGLVGIGSETLIQHLLWCMDTHPEYDLDDLHCLRWIVAEAPWLGVPATLELHVNARRLDPPMREVEEAFLGPVLGRDPRFREAHRAHRRRHPWRDRLARSTSPRRALEGESALLRDRNDRNEPTGVHVFGFLRSPIGIGTMGRGVVEALRTRSIPCRGQALPNVIMDEDLDLEHLEVDFEPNWKTNVFVYFPHRRERMLNLLPESLVADRRNIAYLAWEQQEAHPEWAELFADFDDIWALSRFAGKSLSAAMKRPVHHVPCVLDRRGWPPPTAKSEVGFPRQRRVFLFNFDPNSSIERKNPFGLVEAFRRAFHPRDEVTLWIRAAHGHRREVADGLRRLAASIDATGLDIRLDLRRLDRVDLLRMVSACDAYVSLHHAEGFGYTCAEAMAYGRPTIASGYSGNLDFMDEENSYLVDCEVGEVEIPEGPFVRGSLWGMPDLDHAAHQLRSVYRHPREAARRGRRAALEVKNDLAPETVGRRIQALLEGRGQEERDTAGTSAISRGPATIAAGRSGPATVGRSGSAEASEFAN
ncbi:MAG: glycosyltransferase [Acidobacteria bacterium]|nr:MAG: glycosyltransferase [Acidobacteriota bacterium]REK07916.1 MAG: glycosyltransferase [Acidobacteriota bacterium]